MIIALYIVLAVYYSAVYLTSKSLTATAIWHILSLCFSANVSDFFLLFACVSALYGCAFYFYLGRFMACLQAIYINTWYMKIKLCNKICRWTHWTTWSISGPNLGSCYSAVTHLLLMMVLLLFQLSFFRFDRERLFDINTDFHISFVLSKQHNYSFTEMCAFTTEATRYEKVVTEVGDKSKA